MISAVGRVNLITKQFAVCQNKPTKQRLFSTNKNKTVEIFPFLLSANLGLKTTAPPPPSSNISTRRLALLSAAHRRQSCGGPLLLLASGPPPKVQLQQQQQANGLSLWSWKEAKNRQDELLRLPVPTLAETTERFLKFARPLQSDEEFAETVRLVKEFIVDTNGRMLQRLLEDRSTQLYNWLTPWWIDYAYLECRTPLPIVTSPGVTLPRYPEFSDRDVEGQLEYAAQLIHSLLRFHHEVLEDKLTEDEIAVRLRVPKNVGYKKLIHSAKEPKEEIVTSVPLDMSQYRNLFGTIRIPQRGKDAIQYGKERSDWARHILVTRNGHTFFCPVYNDRGEVLGTEELKAQLNRVIDESGTRNTADAVNIVSAWERDAWADVYTRLKSNNPHAVDAYEHALFVFALDEAHPPASGNTAQTQTPEDANMAMALHGGGPSKNAVNRWFDKTLQFYVNEAGWAGMSYEHTPAEGPPLTRLLDFVCDRIEKRGNAQKVGGQWSPPSRLDFTLSNKDKAAMDAAANGLEKMVTNLEVRAMVFRHFGKNVPKRARLSPDSFIQIALQVAFHRLHGTLPPTYETGTLRRFIDGRTETIRSPTIESAAFVRAFNNSSVPGSLSGEPGEGGSGGFDDDVKQLQELLRKAVDAHKDYTNKAMNGKGMDRHLLGLRLIAREKGLPPPKLLESADFRRMAHFQLSTSQVPTKHTLPMGFGPSHPDCYGLCYNPQEQQIFFTITAFNDCPQTSAARFAEELERALLDLQDLVSVGTVGATHRSSI